MGNIPGWKKTEEITTKGNGLIIYVNTSAKAPQVKRRPTIAIWQTFDGWFVDTPKRTDYQTKTKLQAKAYAKKYMKAHPRG